MITDVLLFAIKPRYALEIYRGRKKVELRRTRPKKLRQDQLVMLYESAPRCYISGCFKVQKIVEATVNEIWDICSSMAALSREEFRYYFHDKLEGVGIFVKWSSSSSVRYAIPIEPSGRATGLGS